MEDLQTQKILSDPDSMSDLSSSVAVFVKDPIVHFCLLMIMCRNGQGTFKDEENERIIPFSTKEFQRTIQQNYPYQAMI